MGVFKNKQRYDFQTNEFQTVLVFLTIYKDLTFLFYFIIFFIGELKKEHTTFHEKIVIIYHVKIRNWFNTYFPRSLCVVYPLHFESQNKPLPSPFWIQNRKFLRGKPSWSVPPPFWIPTLKPPPPFWNEYNKPVRSLQHLVRTPQVYKPSTSFQPQHPNAFTDIYLNIGLKRTMLEM